MVCKKILANQRFKCFLTLSFVNTLTSKPAKLHKKQCGGVCFGLYGIAIECRFNENQCYFLAFLPAGFGKIHEILSKWSESKGHCIFGSIWHSTFHFEVVKSYNFKNEKFEFVTYRDTIQLLVNEVQQFQVDKNKGIQIYSARAI